MMTSLAMRDPGIRDLLGKRVETGQGIGVRERRRARDRVGVGMVDVSMGERAVRLIAATHA